MAETAVQSKVCDICGADVRAGSLYCYNCGGSVSKSVIESPAAVETFDPPVTRNGHAKAASAQHPAKSSAERANRRKVRASNRQPVEVVWEPRTSTSWPFIVGSLLFLFLSLLLLLAALYVR